MYFDQPFFHTKVMMNRKYIFYQDNFKCIYKMTKGSGIAAKDETKTTTKKINNLVNEWFIIFTFPLNSAVTVHQNSETLTI